MHPLLNIAIQAARNAAKIIVRFFDRLDTLEIDEKERNDFVTQVDRYSEEEIIATIRKSYPDHTILAEESGLAAGKDEYVWIIDPLDGTANFIHGFPHFAISIAVTYRNQLEVGVIYDPLRQELFTAARGRGAQLDNRKIRVSQCQKLDRALLGTGFPFKEKSQFNAYFHLFKTIFPNVAGVRRAGAAALDLAYVAAGRLDAYWELGLKPWDMAAGLLLVKEAGGLVGDLDGKSDVMETGNVLVGNPKIYPVLSELILASTLPQK